MERDSLNLPGSSRSLPVVSARDFSNTVNPAVQNGEKVQQDSIMFDRSHLNQDQLYLNMNWTVN